jgi:hypothetical protein
MARGGTKKDGNGRKNNGGQLGFEAELFLAADKLRGNLEPSEYKHVALGLIFLKYISDAFEALHARLEADDYADAEDPDQYLAERVFWVPRQRAGPICKRAPSCPPSASSSTRLWMRSRRTTRTSRACCPRNMAAPRWTR